MDNQRERLAKLFLAAAAATGLGSEARAAWATQLTCSCMPSSQTNAYYGSNFTVDPSDSTAYDANIQSDFYGFNSTAAPHVYLDVYYTGSSEVEVQVCRKSYTGVLVACSSTTDQSGTNQYSRVAVNVTGAYGFPAAEGGSYSNFDYVWLKGRTLVGVTLPFGYGTQRPIIPCT
jgi:hypothetical protein